MTKLTIVVPTIHPQNWNDFSQCLARNSVEFEIIFIGPYGSQHIQAPLPIPTRFITTNATPCACWEIGYRATQTDLICATADDWRYSPGFFDDAIRLSKLSMNVFDTFTGRLMYEDKDCTAGQMMVGDKSMPLLSVAGVDFVEGHRRIGGLDKRFVGTLWDTDLYSRLYVAGGRTTLLCGHVSKEVGNTSTNIGRFMAHDLEVLRSLWTQGDTWTMHRNGGVMSYTDEEVGEYQYQGA